MTPPMSRDEEFASAVEALHQAFAKLRQLSGDRTDAVLHVPSATTYLFPEVQAELRRMERARRQQADERAAILDALPAHLAILDEAGTIVAVNEAWRAFARDQNYRDSTAALGLNYLDVCRSVKGPDENIAQAVALGLERILAGQSDGVSLEYPCQTPEALLWFNLMIAPLRADECSGAVMLHVDITEKHAADRREAELQGRIERLLNQAGIGVLIHRDNVPIFANPALASMLGFDRQEEILGLEDVQSLFHPPQGTETRHATESAVRLEPLRLPGRIAARRQDGRSITFETRIFSITWGEEPAVCAMLTDITDQLRVEEQLRGAQKLEAIGQLTGGIAHDFNNLLTVILGGGDLLVEALEHEPQLKRLAEQTVAMAERGAELTKGLLAFGRRQPLNPQRTDVNGRLVALEALLRRTLGADVEIRLALSGRLWPAMVDSGEFDNAILNLSINSRDAMPDGGRLTIRTDNMDLDAQCSDIGQDIVPGAYVVVSVSDTGTGMDQATMARIFEPFFTTKDVGKGSGLGLSMVYGFVKQTNGHVMIFSEPNEGTTVRLYFPRFSGDERAPGLGSDDDLVRPGQETILIVEDDEAISRQLAMQLATLGYNVFAASEGEPALAIVRERTDIALLLCDIVLPGGMNGRQIADAAQAIRPGLKVLYTSGYSEDTIIHQGRLDPGVELLSKPYRRAELAAKVRKVLES